MLVITDDLIIIAFKNFKAVELIVNISFPKSQFSIESSNVMTVILLIVLLEGAGLYISEKMTDRYPSLNNYSWFISHSSK